MKLFLVHLFILSSPLLLIESEVSSLLFSLPLFGVAELVKVKANLDLYFFEFEFGIAEFVKLMGVYEPKKTRKAVAYHLFLILLCQGLSNQAFFRLSARTTSWFSLQLLT